MSPVGSAPRLIAAGRDCDIFEHGPNLVLRRSRAGRSLALEARASEYVRGFGYPVPTVDELLDGDTAMVMERIDGPSMLEVLRRRPWTVRRQGRALGELHRRLHEIPGPDWLAVAPVGAGDRMLHLDLHPLNVMFGPSGPVVIDWTGAARGDPGVDVALAWALLSAGQVPAGRFEAALLAFGRKLLVNSFLGSAGASHAAGMLAVVVEWKCQDPHMSDAEQEGMRRLARSVSAGNGA